MGQILERLNLQSIFTYFTAAFLTFVVVLWISLIFWTVRDLRSRTQSQSTPLLAGLIVAALGPLGLLIYLILRPPMTLEAAYQQTLESEALLATVADTSLCPGCGASTQAEWQICPQCHTRLRKPCHHCGHLLDLPWKLCPYCTTPVPDSEPEETSISA